MTCGRFGSSPSPIPQPTLMRDLRRLINNNRCTSDVTFTTWKVGLFMLQGASCCEIEHFRALLYGGASRPNQENGQIVIHDVSYAVFLKVLEFLYTDTVSDISPNVAVPLLIVSEKYMLERLEGIAAKIEFVRA